MKKNALFLTNLLFVLFVFTACSVSVDSSVNVHAKGINLPDWQWTSGNVRKGSVGANQAFAMSFNKAIYHAGDSVKITFNSYKVTLTGITDRTTFSKWTVYNTMVCSIDNKWVPLVKDTNSRINKLFSGVRNNHTDSLVNFQMHAAVPASLSLVLTVSPDHGGFEFISGNGKPMFNDGYAYFVTTIKGIQVEKL